jgi:hypothetical protein
LYLVINIIPINIIPKTKTIDPAEKTSRVTPSLKIKLTKADKNINPPLKRSKTPIK